MGPQGLGQFPRHRVAVDVQWFAGVVRAVGAGRAGAVHCQGGDHGYVSPVQDRLDRLAVHPVYFPNVTQLGVGDAGLEHSAVDAAEADCLAAQRLQCRHQLLVDEAGEYCHDDLQAGGVGDPEAPHEPGRDSLALHPVGNNVAAAVDDHDLRAFPLQRHQVSEAGVVAAQGAAADFHNHQTWLGGRA